MMLIKKTIIDTINSFEPRVRVVDVVVITNPDQYSIDVSIEFVIVNTTAPITLDLTLQRTR